MNTFLRRPALGPLFATLFALIFAMNTQAASEKIVSGYAVESCDFLVYFA